MIIVVRDLIIVVRGSRGGRVDVESGMSISAWGVTVHVSMPCQQSPISSEVPLKEPIVRSPVNVVTIVSPPAHPHPDNESSIIRSTYNVPLLYFSL